MDRVLGGGAGGACFDFNGLAGGCSSSLTSFSPLIGSEVSIEFDSSVLLT